MERFKAVLVLMALVLAFGLYTAWGMRPFAGLWAGWIDGAEILPGIPVEGTEGTMQGVLVDDPERLASLLREIVLEHPLQQIDYELTDKAATYWIYFRDGTRRSVTAYRSVVLLDGICWQCREVPSEKLNRYANQLMREAQLENKKERTLCNNSVLSAIKMTSLRRLSV